MLVFIDESGDPGFKVAAGSTPVFALAMIIFHDHEEAARTQRIVTETRARLGVKPEFKFNKCRADMRDTFFDAITGCRFRLRGIVVRKDLIWSERLRSNVESFYSFFLKTMMRFDDQALAHAKVVIDGSGDREFKRNLSAYIQRHVQSGAVSEIKLRNSRTEPCSWPTCAWVQSPGRIDRIAATGTDGANAWWGGSTISGSSNDCAPAPIQPSGWHATIR